MQVERLVVGPIEANCWLAWSGDQALVIDPGDDFALIREALAGRGLGVAACLLTHGHVDHVAAAAALYDAFPAPVGLHAADLAWAFGPRNTLPPFYGPPPRPARIERELADGQHFTDGGLSWEVIATPGHTPGSVCFYLPAHGALFSGDTLFAGSVGRTDLAGGDSRRLALSLHRLTGLPDDTAIYPGHGPATDLAREKRSNYFMQSPRM